MYLVHHLTTTSVYTSSTSKTHSLTPLQSQLRYNFLSWDQTLTLICWKLFSNLRNQSRAMIIESLSPVFICLVWNWRLTDSIIFFTIMWRLNQGPFWRTASTQYFTETFLWSLSSHCTLHLIWLWKWHHNSPKGSVDNGFLLSVILAVKNFTKTFRQLLRKIHFLS